MTVGVEPTCVICGGTKAEHEGRVHAFAEEGEGLETQAQRKKRHEQQSPMAPLAIKMPAGADNLMVTRLIEVLLEAGIIGPAQALYITGVGTKPNPPSGYRDPSDPMPYEPLSGRGY